MTSDPARSQPTRTQRVRYSGTNTPPSEEVALETIESLYADIANIEAKLDHADPDTFSNDKEYRAWRNRATSALGYTRQELTFLERWVGEERRRTVRKSKQGDYKGLELIAQGIRTRAQKLAEEIGSTFTPRYSATIQPKSLTVAQKRMSHLAVVKQQLQGGFAELTAAWVKHPLRKDGLSGAKAPLQTLLSQVEAEIAVVKAYIRTHATRSPNASRWKIVCAGALTRAQGEGFVLTQEELAVLAEILQHIEPD